MDTAELRALVENITARPGHMSAMGTAGQWRDTERESASGATRLDRRRRAGRCHDKQRGGRADVRNRACDAAGGRQQKRGQKCLKSALSNRPMGIAPPYPHARIVPQRQAC
jgi:hypothetical protein